MGKDDRNEEKSRDSRSIRRPSFQDLLVDWV